MAVLKLAVVLFLSAAAPIPVRCLPVVFIKPTRKPMAKLKLALLLLERLRPNGHVKVASGVVLKRPRTNRHVILARSIVSKRINTHGGIVNSHGGVDVVQCVNALSGVAAGIAAIRCRRRQERFRCR